jgi:D-alanine-D-alanine ligase
MSTRLKVAVIYGGNSVQHEISLASAAAVVKHLDSKIYEVIPVGIDKKGHLHVHEMEDLKFEDKSWPVQTDKSFEIPSLIHDTKFFTPVDVVISLTYGGDYENGGLQGLFNLARVPYVSTDVLGSAIGLNKDIARRLACGDGIQSPAYRLLNKNDHEGLWGHRVREMVNEKGWPLIVKPCAGGSSIGVAKVHHLSEALEAIKNAFQYDEEVLVEQAISGREIEVVVIQDLKRQQLRASLPGEINFKNQDECYSYDLKHKKSHLVQYIVPAKIDADWMQTIRQTAIEIFKRIKCKSMARIEFFYDEKNQKLYFNEINTLLSSPSNHLSAMVWDKTGLKFDELLRLLIETAMLQFQIKNQLVTEY